MAAWAAGGGSPPSLLPSAERESRQAAGCPPPSPRPTGTRDSGALMPTLSASTGQRAPERLVRRGRASLPGRRPGPARGRGVVRRIRQVLPRGRRGRHPLERPHQRARSRDALDSRPIARWPLWPARTGKSRLRENPRLPGPGAGRADPPSRRPFPFIPNEPWLPPRAPVPADTWSAVSRPSAQARPYAALAEVLDRDGTRLSGQGDSENRSHNADSALAADAPAAPIPTHI